MIAEVADHDTQWGAVQALVVNTEAVLAAEDGARQAVHTAAAAVPAAAWGKNGSMDDELPKSNRAMQSPAC